MSVIFASSYVTYSFIASCSIFIDKLAFSTIYNNQLPRLLTYVYKWRLVDMVATQVRLASPGKEAAGIFVQIKGLRKDLICSLERLNWEGGGGLQKAMPFKNYAIQRLCPF